MQIPKLEQGQGSVFQVVDEKKQNNRALEDKVAKKHQLLEF
jgi:hypothetical protein